VAGHKDTGSWQQPAEKLDAPGRHDPDGGSARMLVARKAPSQYRAHQRHRIRCSVLLRVLIPCARAVAHSRQMISYQTIEKTARCSPARSRKL
jgi:hypothetical protein